MSDCASDFLALLRKDGSIQSESAKLVPLTGGVSSEIYRVEDGEKVFVVKRALAKLRVEADWHANTSRNRFEQAYIRYVGNFCPEAVPKILSDNPDAGYFCMEYLEGFHNWKADLLAGECDCELALQAGRVLGTIHAHSWSDPEIRQEFDAMNNFQELRIDPYLRATAGKHPQVREEIEAEAARLEQSRQCLMHGDFSPKNLLHRDGRLVIVDCEVACHGDAAFDLAFLINHLLLKSLYHAPASPPLAKMVQEFLGGYANRNPDHQLEVEQTAGHLLPMLLLARVSGKSPVEYLSKDKQNHLSKFALSRISQPAKSLNDFLQDWFENLPTERN